MRERIARLTGWNVWAVLYLIGVASSYVLIRSSMSSSHAWAWRHLNTGLTFPMVSLVLGLVLLGLVVYGASRLDPTLAWARIIRMCLSLTVGAVTWYLRLDHSWGDRTIFLEMLTHDKFLRMSQPLTTAIYALVYRGVALWGWPPRNAIALLCSLTAGVSIDVIRWGLARLPDIQAFPTSLFLVSCSLTVLFFGYVETTVLALTMGLWFLFEAQRYLSDRRSLWRPALALGLAIACHGLSVYLIPGLGFLAWQDGPNGITMRQRIQRGLGAAGGLVLPTVIIVIVALLFPDLIRGSLVGDSMGGEDMRPFVPLFAPRMEHERYTLFSLAHGLDLLNLAFLTSPLVVWILVSGLLTHKLVRRTDWGVFLGLSTLAGLGFAFLWHPDLGMMRDWDLFAPFLLPTLLMGGYLCGILLKRPVLIGAALLSAINSMLFLQSFDPLAVWSPSVQALPVPVMQERTDLVWNERFELIGYDMVPAESISAGQLVELALYFRGLKPMSVGYTVFVHLTDATGKVLAQDDRQPFPPTEYWPPGEVQSSTYTIQIPPDLQPQTRLEIRVGAYFWQTLERLSLTHNGRVLHDKVAVLAFLPVE